MLRIVIVAASLIAFTGMVQAEDTTAAATAAPSACLSLDKTACHADKTCRWHHHKCKPAKVPSTCLSLDKTACKADKTCRWHHHKCKPVKK